MFGKLSAAGAFTIARRGTGGGARSVRINASAAAARYNVWLYYCGDAFALSICEQQIDEMST